LSSGQIHIQSSVRTLIGAMLCLIPIGVLGIIIGTSNGLLQSPLLGAVYLMRRYEYFAFFFFGLLYSKSETHRPSRITILLELAVYANLCVVLLQQQGILTVSHDGEQIDITESFGRVTGTFAGPYELAAFCALVFPYFLKLFCDNKTQTRGLLGLFSIISMVIMTQSRMGLVSLGCVAVLLMTSEREYREKLLPLISVSLLIGVVVIAFTSNSADSEESESRWSTIDPEQIWRSFWGTIWDGNYQNIGKSSVSGNIEDYSFAARIGRWPNYLDGVRRLSPVFGLGPSIVVRAADSSYMRTVFEFGLLGIVILVVVILAIRRLTKIIEDPFLKAIVVWGGIALLIQALFIDVFEASKIAETYWYLLGAGLASGLKHDRNSEAPPTQKLATKHNERQTQLMH
jgi:hypothetical protein